MTPRCLLARFALTAALAIPFAAARADDDAAAPPSGETHASEPALAEPSAPEPSHPEAAPAESAPSDYSSESYPDGDESARAESSGSAPRAHEERTADDDSENKKGKKAKPYDYERSKYKSRELSDNTLRTYRFNEKGEPVVAGEKKKPVAQKTKRSSPRAKRKPAPESCGSAESCAEKKSDADAL